MLKINYAIQYVYMNPLITITCIVSKCTVVLNLFHYLDVETIFVPPIGMPSLTTARLTIKRRDASCWNKVIPLLVLLSYPKSNSGTWR